MNGSTGEVSQATQVLLARHTATQLEAERIMAAGRRAAVRSGFPKPGTSSRGDPRLPTDELVAASCVEMEDVCGEDSIILIGRDPTGKVRLKVWMAKDDASPEWALWIRRWLTRRCRQAIRLMR